MEERPRPGLLSDGFSFQFPTRSRFQGSQLMAASMGRFMLPIRHMAILLLVLAKALLTPSERLIPQDGRVFSPEDAFLRGQFHCIRGGHTIPRAGGNTHESNPPDLPDRRRSRLRHDE